MKILHTSDWHLGKKLEGRDRLEEQLKIIAEIAGLARERDCRIVLVAGDIFDVSTPPAEAERLFYRALKLLSEDGRIVLAVSGNHDDPIRVSCASCLLDARNVLIASPEGFPEVTSLSGCRIEGRSARTLTLGIGDETVTVTGLSYPFRYEAENSADKSYTENLGELLAADLAEWRPSRESQDRTESAGRQGDAERSGLSASGRHILLTHLFVAGASVTGEERSIEVGGIRVADVSLFEPYDYVALGHIHRFQRIKNGCYCGSITQYAFDERQDKGVVIYDTADNGVEFVPLRAGKKLVRIAAEAVDLGMAELARCPDSFVELTLKLDRPLTFSENKLLKGFSNLASLRMELEVRQEQEKSYRFLSPDQLFSAFWESSFGREPSGEVLAEFLSLFHGEEVDEKEKSGVGDRNETAEAPQDDETAREAAAADGGRI